MKEGYSTKGLDIILTADELRMLFEYMDDPRFYLLEKVNRAVKEDWIEQTANIDFSAKDDEEMKRIVRQRHGMIKGVTLFFQYLQKKRKDLREQQK